MSFALALVGTNDRPASPEDIEDVRKLLAQVKSDPHLSLVTHHAIRFIEIKEYAGCATVYKLGNDDRPALPEDIEDFQKELERAKAEKRPVVWYHAVDVDYVTF